MVSDGVENCLRYIRNFNPEKSNNPFAYFTQISYYAFLRRIQREKKQLMIKAKYVQSTSIDDDIASQIDNEINSIDPNSESFKQYLQPLYDIDIKAYEEKTIKPTSTKTKNFEGIV